MKKVDHVVESEKYDQPRAATEKNGDPKRVLSQREMLSSFGKKSWKKLGNIFKMFTFMNHNQVTPIRNPWDLDREFEGSQTTSVNYWKTKTEGTTRTDQVIESLVSFRLVEKFCECAVVGGPKEIEKMKRILMKDPST